jgi:hypothetical protein
VTAVSSSAPGASVVLVSFPSSLWAAGPLLLLE